MNITNKRGGRKLETRGKVNKNKEPDLQLVEISAASLKPVQLYQLHQLSNWYIIFIYFTLC